jgi:hypothetical protein
MKIRAKIALCTDRGPKRRGEEFVTTAEQGQRWIDQGKAELVNETSAPRAAPAKKPKRPKAKPAPKPVEVVAAPAPEPVALTQPPEEPQGEP